MGKKDKKEETAKKAKRKDKLSRKEKIKQEIKSWIIIILIAVGLKATVIEAYQVPTGSMENTILVGDFLLGNKFIYGPCTPRWIGIPWTRIGFGIPWIRLPKFRKPKQNDVVIFKFPKDTYYNYVKRCVAGPGQTIEIRDKVIYVDGKRFKNAPNAKFISNFIYPKGWNEPGIFPKGAGNKDNYGPVYVPAKGDTLWFGIHNTDIIRNVVELAHHKFELRNGKMYIDGKYQDYYVVEQDHYFMIGDNRDNSYDSRYWGFVPYELITGKALLVYFSWDKNIPFFKLLKKFRWTRIGKIIS
ncbi:MAG: signal peptidase I [Candidatus Marinimicrobia bacterium]|nr:signal peptidase I [Candidatus Neomarinimicrobiota bacterium]